MIIEQDPDTGYWNVGFLSTHPPEACEGCLCDVHNRRGKEPWASWPLNWREDRGLMEVICPHGIGHPSAAQVQYWRTSTDDLENGAGVHGCDGCCEGQYV